MQTKDFKGQDLRGKSFKNQDLTGADFSDCDLRGVNFSFANLTDAKFCNARMGRTFKATLILLSFQLSISFFGGFLVSMAVFLSYSSSPFSYSGFLHFPSPYYGIVYLISYHVLLNGILLLGLFKQSWRYIAWFYIFFVFISVMNDKYYDFMLATISQLTTIAVVVTGVVFISIGASIGTIDIARIEIVTTLVASSGVITAIRIDLSENDAIVSVAAMLPVIGTGISLSDSIICSCIYLAVAISLTSRFINYEELPLLFLRNWGMKLACWYGTEFTFSTLQGADFFSADLKYARFKNAKMNNCNFKNAKNHHLTLTTGTPLEMKRVRELVINGNISIKDLSFLNIDGLDFSGLDLHDFNFANANINFANFAGCNLTNANLSKVNAVGACFNDSTMTGACIENWNIDNRTQLQAICCDYVYLTADKKERNPLDGEFAAGEFSKLYQHIADTIDFIVHSREELDSLIAAIETIKQQGGAALFVQTIERKESSVVLRVKALPEFDREQIYKEVKKEQKKQLKQIKADYEQKLLAKDNELDQQRKHNDLLADLLKDAMQRPVTVHNHNTLENKPLQIDEQIISGGNQQFADTMTNDNSRHQSFDGTASNANINFGDNAALTNIVQPLDNQDEKHTSH